MEKKNNEQITIAGFGGQGVMTIGQILAHTAIKEELNSIWFPSYGPETRGGTANCAVIISKDEIYSPIFQLCDTLIVLNSPSLEKFQNRVSENGIVLYNSSLINKNQVIFNNSYGVPMNDIAQELGNDRVANMVILGAYLELRKIFDLKNVLTTVEEYFGVSKASLIDINTQAIDAGRKYIMELKEND